MQLVEMEKMAEKGQIEKRRKWEEAGKTKREYQKKEDKQKHWKEKEETRKKADAE